MLADTPIRAHALATENGGGDKQALAEVLNENLDLDELDELINKLVAKSNERHEARDGDD
jgi:hypothetical protein